jgi:hypothetical protein
MLVVERAGDDAHQGREVGAAPQAIRQPQRFDQGREYHFVLLRLASI